MTDAPTLYSQLRTKLLLDRLDSEAWEVLYVLMWPHVVTKCHRYAAGDAELAEECAQATLIRLAKYAPFDELVAWPQLLAYSRSVCRNVVTSALKARGVGPTVALDEAGYVADNADPADELAAKELFAAMKAQLSPAEAALLTLLVQGYSLPDICRRLGVTYGAAGARVHRLRRSLAKWLEGL